MSDKGHHFCEHMMTAPWSCGERDCPVGWHLSTYFLDSESESGYSVSPYGDGDFEDISEDEIPTCEEHSRAWSEYHRHVLRTGEEPLEEYIGVRGHYSQPQTWQLKIETSPDGPRLQGARRGARGPWTKEIPKHVYEFMELEKTEQGEFVLTEYTQEDPELGESWYWDVLSRKTEEWTPQRARTCAAQGILRLKIDVPRSDIAVQQDLKRHALESLKRQNL